MHSQDETVVVGGCDLLPDAQQAFEVTAVEGMDLREFGGQEISWPFGHDFLESVGAAIEIAVDPALDGCKPSLFASVGASGRGLGAGEIALGGGVAFIRIHGQHQAGCDQGQHQALFFLVGGSDERREAVAEGQPLLPDEIERRDCAFVGIAQLQLLTVAHHVSLPIAVA